MRQWALGSRNQHHRRNTPRLLVEVLVCMAQVDFVLAFDCRDADELLRGDGRRFFSPSTQWGIAAASSLRCASVGPVLLVRVPLQDMGCLFEAFVSCAFE